MLKWHCTTIFNPGLPVPPAHRNQCRPGRHCSRYYESYYAWRFSYEWYYTLDMRNLRIKDIHYVLKQRLLLFLRPGRWLDLQHIPAGSMVSISMRTACQIKHKVQHQVSRPTLNLQCHHWIATITDPHLPTPLRRSRPETKTWIRSPQCWVNIPLSLLRESLLQGYALKLRSCCRCWRLPSPSHTTEPLSGQIWLHGWTAQNSELLLSVPSVSLYLMVNTLTYFSRNLTTWEFTSK